MPTPIKIDFVSDVSCPWCAIGLKALEQAIECVGDAVEVELHIQPFELNPQMPPEGQDATEHLVQKYGSSPQQLEQNRAVIRARGAELGFTFSARDRVYNTFDSHRLLHWAGLQDRHTELALKHALLRAYFTDGHDVSSHEVLVKLAQEVGLDAALAREILVTDVYTYEVRALQRFYAGQGITAVPSVIFNDSHLIQGGQPVETFERALRQLAAA